MNVNFSGQPAPLKDIYSAQLHEPTESDMGTIVKMNGGGFGDPARYFEVLQHSPVHGVFGREVFDLASVSGMNTFVVIA